MADLALLRWMKFPGRAQGTEGLERQWRNTHASVIAGAGVPYRRPNHVGQRIAALLSRMLRLSQETAEASSSAPPGSVE